MNKELEGPHYAVRLLAHKIQSPIERESLYALTVSFVYDVNDLCSFKGAVSTIRGQMTRPEYLK